jgi:LPS-assembly protein
MRRLLLALAAALTLAGPLPAQQPPAPAPASLVADTIFINADNTLIAEGAVEILYQGTRLTARRLTYDPRADRLTIEGPIAIDDGQGTVLLASDAELSGDLRNGILNSARLVLQDQMQLAAAQIRRVDGRYTQLSRVVASSCQVCPSNPRPLWELRASRVIHDNLERQLYFDNAQFRVAGIPVFYFPRLRMPDPTVDRANGFLMPSVRSSSELGFGIRLPYFLTLGDSRDLTVTPYVTVKGSRTLGLRYRQAFATGQLSFTGAVTRDRVLPDDTRGYLFGEGSFSLPRGFTLGFQVETVSDDAYLLDYGITDKDRLASGVYVLRTKRDSYADARVFRYHSLRAGDSNQFLPTLVGDLSFVRRVTPDLIGGQGELRFDLHSVGRKSNIPFDANGDGVTDGRDMTRATLGLNWRRQEVLANGMILGGGLGLTADVFSIREDDAFPGTVTRVTPAAAIDLRWPWVRAGGRNRATQVIEPVVQLVWTGDPGDPVPNEDSLLVEFDEGNLFSFSRFPGGDIYENGLRANLGVTWTRRDPLGWSFTAAGGRVLRSEDLGQFSTGSRLSGTRSDWLLAMQLATPDGLAVTNRALFDDGLDFSKNELRFDWYGDRGSLAASYIWLVADPAEGRPTATAELAFDTGWEVRPGWRATANGRYDFETERAARAGIGLEYRNECAAVDLSLSRRFTSSTSVRPTTEIGLAVRLAGFGTGADGRQYRRSCGG